VQTGILLGVYILLGSMMIPSLFNLIVGGVALSRGIPRLSRYLCDLMPSGQPMPPLDGIQVASLLAAQTVIGAFFLLLAQAILLVGIIGYIMPWLGWGILDLVRTVAAFNLPSRLFRLLS